jgi:hypothetical protein
MKRILLGQGRLSWAPIERVSDRYGTVTLFKSWDGFSTVDLIKTVESKGKLIAVVKNVATSRHVGDLFHKIYPFTPEVGDEIVLGEGKLFYTEDSVGIEPVDDDRDDFWLDPKQLYKVHDQTVVLYFEPSD